MVAAGCSTMVDGKPMAEVLSAGQPAPVEWGPCRVVGGDAAQIPAGAQCGKITVPIDYSKPDGAVANLALIRFPATDQKIGSLVINPGRRESQRSPRSCSASTAACPQDWSR